MPASVQGAVHQLVARALVAPHLHPLLKAAAVLAGLGLHLQLQPQPKRAPRVRTVPGERVK